jgi:hypothetical protein
MHSQIQDNIKETSNICLKHELSGNNINMLLQMNKAKFEPNIEKLNR